MNDPRELAKTLAEYQLKLAINEAWKYLQASGSTPAHVLSAREVIQLTRTVLQGAAFLAFEAPQTAGTQQDPEAGKWLDHLSDAELLAFQRAREKARQAT